MSDEDAWTVLALGVFTFVLSMLGVLLDWGPICHHVSMGVC